MSIATTRRARLIAAAFAALTLGVAGCANLHSGARTEGETGGARDPGAGPWTRVAPEDLARECKLDLGAMQKAESIIGAPFAVVRYGKLCYEYYPDGGDSSTHVFSTTKTLGALAVGAVIEQTKSIPVSTTRKKGPLLEFQRVDHWLDEFPYHPDSTIAHVLGSVSAASSDLSYPNRQWRYDTRGLEALNSLSDVINIVIAQDPARLGNNIGEFWTRRFAEPLGLENSRWGDSDASKIFGYTWFATVRDMARVGLLMLNGGVWNGERLIDEQFLYDLSHPSFEDAGLLYGYLAWLNGPDDCAPKPIHRQYPHGPVSGAPSCLNPEGCSQTYDVGVFAASGARGQYIGVHRGLDMVLVVKDLGDPQKAKDGLVWGAIRPALLAFDPVYAGDEAGFCKAYSRGDYAPDLKLWEGGR
ncbi:MAG: serine hydrolase [Amphiplicatus sp.]